MIPKRVHYIWVGGPMPEKNRQLLAHNARFLEGYDVKIWTESELDLTPPFVQRAYAAKKWAFVSDYARFVLLRDLGGIYLDTDMELLRPIDELLAVPAFSGYNQSGSHVYCGLIGATAGHPLFVQIIKDYDAVKEGYWPTSPEMLTRAIKAMPDASIKLHPAADFYPVQEGEKPNPAKLATAYATHHWDESWRSFVPLRRFLRRIGLMRVYHALLAKLATDNQTQ